jgi:hypothetical protein
MVPVRVGKVVGCLVVISVAAGCSSGGSSSHPTTTAGSPSPDSAPASTDGSGEPTATTGTPSTAPGTDGATTAVSAAAFTTSVESLRGQLPADEAGAARALVETLRTSDDRTLAVAATGELLRRAGFAIVAGDGAVVARPDDVAFSDIPIYLELLPNITRSVRAGDLYSVDSIGQLFADLELTDVAVPWPQLATALASWGKPVAGDTEQPPSFIASAAATVRALSGDRGQVFTFDQPEAEQGLDALQLLILVGHAGGVPVPVPARAASGFVGTAGRAWSRPAGLVTCDDLKKALSPEDQTQTDKLVVDLGKWGIGKNLDLTVDALKDLAKEFPESGLDALHFAQRLQRAGKVYDLANKVASYASIVTLLLGTTLDLSTDKLTTHYKHEDGTRDEEVWAAAYAEFNSPLAQARLACYSLAGLDVPKNGPMSGINVRWSLGQDLRPSATGDLASGAHLRPTKDSEPKFTIDKTNADGISEVHLKPPVESADTDKQGPVSKGTATLTAHLEKGELPFQLSDLTAVLDLDVKKAVIGKAIDALKSIAVDELLPTASVTIGVTYHGADPVIAKVENSVFLFLYTIPRVYTDLVSCNGLAGPFTGTGGYSTIGIDVGGVIQNAGAGAIGLPLLPESSPAQDNPLEVAAPAPGAGPTRFLVAQGDSSPFVEGLLELDANAGSQSNDALGWVSYDVGDGRLGQRVGSLELLLTGRTWPFSDLSGSVYRVTSDPRCPPSEVHWDGN